MKNWMMVFIFICLVIPFQNCSKTAPISSGGDDTSSAQSDEKVIPLKPAQAKSIEMPASSLGKAAADDAAQLSSLLVYPKTGLIDALLENGQVSAQHYCLKSEQIAVLEGLLSAAKICDAKSTAGADQVCTMIYRSPYAKLNFADQSISLGEMRSGCNVGIDLCGSSAKNLQNFLMNVVVDLSTLKCDLEAL